LPMSRHKHPRADQVHQKSPPAKFLPEEASNV
jgi:hypothetical protein